MLFKCPECELQVSDKAISCPHCGYPLKPEAVRVRKPRNNKRKRLPNGFGQISEIKGRALRKPFRAMVTVGKTPEGRPICKLLKPEAYFETYNDAYQALMEYNKNPFDISKKITMSELYEEWERYYTEKHQPNKTYKGAWKYCSSVYGLDVREIRPRHLRYCVDKGQIMTPNGPQGPTDNTKHVIHVIFNNLLNYAVEHDIIDHNTVANVQLGIELEAESGHIAFTYEEMKALWMYVGKIPNIEIILIQCYTGLRPGEMPKLTVSNTHIKERYIIGGSKTDAGRDRIIPIHPMIMPYIKANYDYAVKNGKEALLHYSDLGGNIRPLNYKKLSEIYKRVIERLELNPQHKPHDGRKTFVTLAKENDMDEYALKRIIGHKISDITERVYTERSVDWLLSEIQKIK